MIQGGLPATKCIFSYFRPVFLPKMVKKWGQIVYIYIKNKFAGYSNHISRCIKCALNRVAIIFARPIDLTKSLSYPRALIRVSATIAALMMCIKSDHDDFRMIHRFNQKSILVKNPSYPL